MGFDGVVCINFDGLAAYSFGRGVEDGGAVSVGNDGLKFFVECRAGCATFEVVDMKGDVEVVEWICVWTLGQSVWVRRASYVAVRV